MSFLDILDTLLPGSYKGVPFLVNRVSTSGGRKTVIHKFPNSDIQTIEDLGLEPRTYRIGAIIASPGYTVKKNLLLRALEEGGQGLLVHPFFGPITGIVALSFSFDEDLTHVGDTTFDITFGLSETDGRPINLINTISQISSSAVTVADSIATDITDLFTVTNNFPGNFSNASDKLNSISDALLDNSKTVAAEASKINEFSSNVSSFRSSINSLIQTPEQLGTTLEDLFAELPLLYEASEDRTRVLSLFSNFGDSDDEINETTAGLIERKQNNDILNNAVQGFTLAQAYLSAAQTEFTTVVEIENTSDELELSFQAIKTDSGLGIMTGLSQVTMSDLEDLRVTAQKFFDEQKVSAKQIISVQTPELPARLISYQYYGSSDLGANIANLNNEINVSNLDGVIDIFTV